MPEAMLFAKLTLCSHGNGSCWSPARKHKTKRNESKSWHQVWKWAKWYLCNYRGYCVLASAATPFHLGTHLHFIYSAFLPADMPAGPLRRPEPTYRCRVDFRSTSSHMVNSSFLRLLKVCFVFVLRCKRNTRRRNGWFANQPVELTVSLIKSLRVPPSMNSVIKLSLLSL